MQELTIEQFTLDTLQLEQTFNLQFSPAMKETELPAGNYRVICGELVRIVKGVPSV